MATTEQFGVPAMHDAGVEHVGWIPPMWEDVQPNGALVALERGGAHGLLMVGSQSPMEPANVGGR